ncbi:MAG: family 43 glycosylhydrolase [Oscillospiraceae bacterium]|nr:family 43 glycosylhydrolase [Oscillospiraceae bacterium]
MKNQKSRITACLLSSAMCMSLALPAYAVENDSLTLQDAIPTSEGISISAENISTENYKDTKYNNPISSDFFCADPTSVEYNGRLYLFGTNDHQQFEIAGADKDNTYEQIKSMLVFSTDDMVNWVYHGEINIGQIAPWITNSWAPSVVSRVENDGLTHFYMYFSNNGLGVGVITSTDPVTGWTDPLGKPLISTNTPGLTNCPNPFDPGAVIDENGTGWLSFGAGKASNGTDYMPGSARIVQLGDDMISFASEFKEIPAPYLFEASELNYINGTYVYTYCSDWADHSKKWEYDCPAPGGCGMVYMTTKTPLDSSSWEMKGECFVNPGVSGFDYSNNHTHMHKFKDKWYMFYHTLELKKGMGISGSYRSMGVDEIAVDEDSVTIEKTGGTKKGASAIAPVSPFEANLASELNGTAKISYDLTDPHAPAVTSQNIGSWFSVRDVQFTESPVSVESQTEPEFHQQNLDTVEYHLTVTSVDKNTTVTMYPADNSGNDCAGSVDVTGTGKYTITCDLGGAKGFMNMGYFRASDDAQITFILDSITINGKYTVDISSELTNTREWADGLRNIWNGFSDGDAVYTSEYAVFRYIKADDAIELFASDASVSDKNANAPLLETPVAFLANVKGKGRVEVRLDSPTGEILSSIDFDTAGEYQNIYNKAVTPVSGTHDLYFIFSEADISMQSWTFTETEEDVQSDTEELTETTTEDAFLAGDASGDGTVDILDVIVINRAILGKEEISEKQLKAIDFNQNNKPDSSESLAVMKYIVGLITSFDNVA